MKKWFFSDNGKVSGPFGLEESNKMVASNPALYAWHPSYSQWVPATYVTEFELSIKPPAAPQEVPQELIEEFIGKEREAIEILARVEKTLNLSANTLTDIEAEIENYNNITDKLNTEVESAVKKIEQQFKDLQANLSGVGGSSFN
jgi:hypothetical protein